MATRALFGVVAVLLAASCGDPESVKKRGDENACLKASFGKEKGVKADLLRQRKEARDTNQSTTQIVLAQRRAVEQFCIEQAKCFEPQSDKARSNQIEWCIDEADE